MASFSLLFVLLLHFFPGTTNAAVFTFQNSCNYTIWPGILSKAGIPLLMNGGFQLNANENLSVSAPTGWSGRFWARTGCTFDQSGRQNCTTGDCGGFQCAGRGGLPPATLAEFTLDSPRDFYDVSLVDGFNLPISIRPQGEGDCSAVICESDVNSECPKELQVRQSNGDGVVACKSACLAFDHDQYCCRGAYNNPTVCKATNYSEVFKKACPKAYSYAYDDATSIFTCKGGQYLINFCN